ncbi:hypothetical protein D3C87_49640 [compost metagenome]
MEYLLKQYKHYVTDGQIDHDLLQIDSTQMFLSGIPSLVDKKYITSAHSSISRIQQYFFDRHAILSGRRKQGDDRNLFQILMTERVIITELEDYQRHYIDQIVNEGFLFIAEANTIQMVSPIQIFIAGEIREYGCMSYWHYSKPIRETIDKLIGEGILNVINQLLTPKEIS